MADALTKNGLLSSFQICHQCNQSNPAEFYLDNDGRTNAGCIIQRIHASINREVRGSGALAEHEKDAVIQDTKGRLRLWEDAIKIKLSINHVQGYHIIEDSIVQHPNLSLNAVTASNTDVAEDDDSYDSDDVPTVRWKPQTRATLQPGRARSAPRNPRPSPQKNLKRKRSHVSYRESPMKSPVRRTASLSDNIRTVTSSPISWTSRRPSSSLTTTSDMLIIRANQGQGSLLPDEPELDYPNSKVEANANVQAEVDAGEDWLEAAADVFEALRQAKTALPADNYRLLKGDIGRGRIETLGLKTKKMIESLVGSYWEMEERSR